METKRTTGSPQAASARSSLNGNHQNLTRLDRGRCQTVEFDDPSDGFADVPGARLCRNLPQRLTGLNGGRRRPARSAREASGRDAERNDHDGCERQATHRRESAQLDRWRAVRPPSGAPGGLTAHRPAVSGLKLSAALRPHGWVMRRQIRRSHPGEVGWPPDSRGDGSASQFHGEFRPPGRRRCPGEGGHRRGRRHREGPLGRRPDDGTRAERTGSWKPPEHMFDERLFDTLAGNELRVQNVFEHMFETVVDPP